MVKPESARHGVLTMIVPLNALFRCLRLNVDASYHKHFVVVSHHERTYQWLVSSTLPQSDTAVCITLGGRTTDNTRWSQILVENCHYCLPHLHLTSSLGSCHPNVGITFGVDKLKWYGYLTVIISF